MKSSDIFILIGAIGTICSIAFGYAGYQKGLRKENYEDGNSDGEIKADTQYIKRRIDDGLLEQRNMNTVLNSHGERITRVEESSKQAHKRIDGIEEKEAGR